MFGYLRRPLLLVAEDVRADARRAPRQVAFLADVRRLQPHLPAAAHARAARHAAPDLDVPPRRALGGLQPHLVDRVGRSWRSAMLVFLVNVWRTNVCRKGGRAGNDPWLADTLEWYTTSPPPPHNFDCVPYVTSARPLRDLRRRLAEERRDRASRPAPGCGCRRSSLRRGRCSPSSPARRTSGRRTGCSRRSSLPPLAALLVSAWCAHRRLVPAALARRGALHRCRGGSPGRTRTSGSRPSRWRRSCRRRRRASAASGCRGGRGATTSR